MTADPLSTTLAALADPTRRGILARLSSGEATVTELAAPYDMSLAAVSKHLKVLEHAGLITRGRDAQFRPCRLEAAPMQAVAGWLEDYRRFWDASLDQLEDYLTELQQGDPDAPPQLKPEMDRKVVAFRLASGQWLRLARRRRLDSLETLAAYLNHLQGDPAMPALNLVAPIDDPIITGAPRLLAAPPALVWKCLSQPEHIARWWGPASLGTLTVKELDFRVGGRWRFEHALKRGPVIVFTGVYRVIEPVSRLINTFSVEGMFGGGEVEETHLLEDRDGRTLYTSVMRFGTMDMRDGMLASGMEKGAAESMAQLDALLAELVGSSQ